MMSGSANDDRAYGQYVGLRTPEGCAVFRPDGEPLPLGPSLARRRPARPQREWQHSRNAVAHASQDAPGLPAALNHALRTESMQRPLETLHRVVDVLFLVGCRHDEADAAHHVYPFVEHCQFERP